MFKNPLEDFGLMKVFDIHYKYEKTYTLNQAEAILSKIDECVKINGLRKKWISIDDEQIYRDNCKHLIDNEFEIHRVTIEFEKSSHSPFIISWASDFKTEVFNEVVNMYMQNNPHSVLQVSFYNQIHIEQNA